MFTLRMNYGLSSLALSHVGGREFPEEGQRRGRNYTSYFVQDRRGRRARGGGDRAFRVTGVGIADVVEQAGGDQCVDRGPGAHRVRRGRVLADDRLVAHRPRRLPGPRCGSARCTAAGDGWSRPRPSPTLTASTGSRRSATTPGSTGPAAGHRLRVRGARDGATPVQGTFATAPTGRVPFRFTSVGDLAHAATRPGPSRRSTPPTTVHQIEQFNPLFHLHNGDLSYANVNQASQPQVWADFMNNIQAVGQPHPVDDRARQPRSRSGPTARSGYASYQTRFDAAATTALRVRLAGQLVQLPGGIGAVHLARRQRRRTTPTTASTNPANASAGAVHPRLQQRRADRVAGAHPGGRARRDPSIDWIVVYMHQPIMSSSSAGAGGDLGIRQAFLPPVRRTTGWTWCSPATTTTTSGPTWSAAPTRAPPAADRGEPEPGPVDASLGRGAHGDRRRRHVVARRRVRRGTVGSTRSTAATRSRRSTWTPPPTRSTRPSRTAARSHLVGGTRPGHHPPVGHRDVRRRPGRAPGRPDVDQGDLLPHAGGDGGEPVPGAGRRSTRSR